MVKLGLILGDQLSPSLSALGQLDRKRDRVLMAEVLGEATYVNHHPKKIALIFAAMRKFAGALRADGWNVDYVRLDDPENSGSLVGEVNRFAKIRGISETIVTEAGEWRVRNELAGLPNLTICEDDRFVATQVEFEDWAEGRKELRMEYFYRLMRRKTGLLMEGDKPVGGKWNFDAENRKAAAPDLFMPQPLRFEPDEATREVLGIVEAQFGENFGNLLPFWFATDRQGALASAEQFIAMALPNFGTYQDAMLTGRPFLYHSVLSIYMNIGLLDPLELCRMAERAFHEGHAPLNAVEGFIRQIIGWREYVRCIYFMGDADYSRSNALEATRNLPPDYWSGDTQMKCMAEAITQTKEEAYAHHIQRLMVTGNFALLAGIDPYEVHTWYLEVYADAFEWVEAPNVIGMSQFADGGVLASKPYAASGAYINRMSDYCANCHYDVKDREGPQACPFNALYWDFLARNRSKLGKNQRLSLAYRNWDKMTEDVQSSICAKADDLLEGLDTL